MAEPYRFPHNNRAYASSLSEQADKVVEEAKELIIAMQSGDEQEIIFEAYDLIQATEGVLRKCDQEKAYLGWFQTVEKCARRGEYDKRIIKEICK